MATTPLGGPIPNASRYEGGTPNVIGALSLTTSIEVLAQAGPRIAPHVLALTDRLEGGLRARGAAASEAARGRSGDTRMD